MRVSVNNFDDFIENMKSDHKNVFRRTIFFRVDEFQVDEQNEVDYHVQMSITTVIEEPSCPFVLEYIGVIGIHDRNDKEPEVLKEGQAMIDRLQEFAAEYNLKTLPGKVEFA